MTIPDYQSLMRPVLEAINDGNVWASSALRDAVAAQLGLSDEDRQERLASGTRLFDSRVHWAVTYLNQAKVLSREGRAQIRITERGQELLTSGPARIDVKVLEQYPEFVEFISRWRSGKGTSGKGGTADGGGGTNEVGGGDEVADPQERISEAVAAINTAVAAELVERIKSQPPEFLERIILDLMVAMNYGAILGRAEHLGGSGDEGFDGVIHQDALGLERVYLQAKRYTDNTVGRPAVQAFAGALQGAGANRGVFITTSKFTAEAKGFAERLPARVVLIDGPELGRLLVKHRVGVQVKETYDVVAVDDDVFDM